MRWLKRIIGRSADANQAAIGSWSAEIDLKNKLTLEDAKFIFAQAEKLLNDSVATSETIVSRMNTLIALITAGMFGFTGYIIAHMGKDFMFDSAMFTASVGTIIFYVLALYSFQNNQPKDYLLPGSTPKDLFNPAFFPPELENEDRLIRYYVNEIENYMYRIEINNAINEKRWSRYSVIAKCLLWMPPILLVCYILTGL